MLLRASYQILKTFISFTVLPFFWMVLPVNVNGQEVDFSSYKNYSITVDNITMGDLVFGEPVISGGGIYEIELNESYVFAVHGLKFLDVGVNIYGDGELLLNGDPANSGDPQKSIPFTLKAAYSNQGQNNISDAIFISIASGNIGNARFPILTRQKQPPVPPPPPVDGTSQAGSEETAYLFFYGEIDVGNVNAGLYSGTITIQVEYE